MAGSAAAPEAVAAGGPIEAIRSLPGLPRDIRARIADIAAGTPMGDAGAIKAELEKEIQLRQEHRAGQPEKHGAIADRIVAAIEKSNAAPEGLIEKIGRIANGRLDPDQAHDPAKELFGRLKRPRNAKDLEEARTTLSNILSKGLDENIDKAIAPLPARREQAADDQAMENAARIAAAAVARSSPAIAEVMVKINDTQEGRLSRQAQPTYTAYGEIPDDTMAVRRAASDALVTLCANPQVREVLFFYSEQMLNGKPYYEALPALCLHPSETPAASAQETGKSAAPGKR